MKNQSIPNEKEWEGYKNDLDAIDFHAIAYGKSNDELQEYFKNRGTLIFAEFELLPRPVFQYYILGFANFTMSPAAKNDSDSASMFLALLETREESDKGGIKDIYTTLSSTVDFIANNQEYFDADIDIYGSFKERAKLIRGVCNA